MLLFVRGVPLALRAGTRTGAIFSAIFAPPVKYAG